MVNPTARPRSNAAGEATRTALIDTAERLFAERGLDVSLREIALAAGQRRPNAGQYHFGDRDGLVDAILRARTGPIDERRNALLERVGNAHHDLANALIEPLAEDLDRDGLYLQFLVRLQVARKGLLAETGDGGPHLNPSFQEIVTRLRASNTAVPLELLRTRVQLGVDFAVMALANRAAAERSPSPVKPSRKVFLGEVVRITAAILGEGAAPREGST